MTDAEISRQLALAIGWPRTAVVLGTTGCYVWCGNRWRTFDYRDPAVIWPIAERYKCFPWKWEWGRDAWCSRIPGAVYVAAPTAAEAVALAVIGAQG